MTNEQFIREWLASYGEAEGRHGNLSARNRTLYSYHMPIARWLNPADRCWPVLVLTTVKRSRTTTRHTNLVRVSATTFTTEVMEVDVPVVDVREEDLPPSVITAK